MSNFLSKLFKPKWQHKNVATRLEAITTLDPNQDKDRTILLELAQSDLDAGVRTASLAKINDSQLLVKEHKRAEGAYREALEARLYELASSQSLSIFDLIVDSKLLTEMIVSASNPDAFINGLARIEDATALLNIAMTAKTSKIRQAAAELIETENELKELVQAVKSKDKGVYQIAKTKFDKLKNEAKVEQELNAAIATLVQAVEEHARTDNTKLYESKLESLEQRWAPLANRALDEDSKRFEQAQQACKARINAQKQAEAEAAEAELIAKAGGDELKATLLTLEQTLEQLRDTPASAQEVASLDAILKTQETRWLEATRQVDVEKGDQKHYQNLMSSLRHYLSAQAALAEGSEKLSSLCADLNKAKTSAEQNDAGNLVKLNKALNQALKTINWPTGFTQPEQIKQAQNALGLSEDLNRKIAQSVEEITKDIDTKINALDTKLADRQVKESNKLLKQIQSLSAQLPRQQSDKVHNQLTLRIKALNDLRDWQGFASSPRQQELCDQMERLAEQSMSPQDKADKIKAMQQEWKALGGASDEALWVRFKAASDAAYEPCKAYFAEQSALKEANLGKRQTLITQLTDFVENNDWSNADWRAADQINRKARQEWRDAYPVDHRKNRSAQKAFNALLSQLDEKLDAERAKNLDLKASVVERAEALVAHEDLTQAMNDAKQLQQEWQGIGITEHKKDRALWKRFRTACDQVFARRDQERDARNEEFAAAEAEAKALIETYRARLSDTLSDNVSDTKQNADEIKATLDELRRDNKNLPKLGNKAANAHQEAFENLIKDAKAALKRLKNVQRIAQWQQVVARSATIRKAYLGDDIDQDAFDAELKNTNDLNSELADALKSLWIGVKAQAVKSSDVIDETFAREMCIRCEIAAGMDSPESDKELRMQLQVTRLSEGMSSSDSLSREEQLESLLTKWFSKVGLAQDLQDQYDDRIRQTIEVLFAVKG